MNNGKAVKIYTTPGCHFCHKAKEYFKSRRIQYEEIDVSRDMAKGKEMIEKSGQIGVPVIEIDGKIVIGFDRPKIDKYLRQ